MKIYGEISSLEFSRSKRKTNLMNSAQVSRLSLKLKLIANTPCTSTKIYFPTVKGYNDHFCFRVFPLICPCFYCFVLLHFLNLSPISLVIFFYYLPSAHVGFSCLTQSWALNFLYISSIVPNDVYFFNIYPFLLFHGVDRHRWLS